MSKFIMVNSNTTNDRIRINVDHIVRYQSKEKDGYGKVVNGTYMILINKDDYFLKENVREIDELIKGES